MSIANHIKEHSKIGLPFQGGGTSLITVGPGGMFQTFQAAVDYRNTLSHTLVETVTGSVTGTTSGTVEIRKITHAATSTNIGKKLWAQVAGTGVLIQCERPATTFTLSRYPFKADFASQTVDLYTPKWATILFLPGYDELITANITLPSFTVFKSLVPYAAQLRFDSTHWMVGGLDAQEFWFDGLRILGDFTNTITGKILLFTADPGGAYLREHANYGFFNCHIDGPHVDIIQWPMTASGLEGGLFVENCKVSGHYDLFRCANNREVFFNNNNIYCYNNSYADSEGCGIALGFLTASKTAYPLKVWQVLNNNIEVITEGDYPAYGVKVGVTDAGTPIQAYSDTRTIIRGNTIKTLCLGSTENVAGVAQLYAGADADTPYIAVTGNTFDVRNLGTGTALWTNSAKAGMNIQRGGNHVINGTLGSNTTALTLA